ncbi:hypothetical protein ACKGJO_07900 [Gracilimonas sp. Q87]|uniref:hypothetical protein n=1 Tax=Gracilimonas sp. Q87 TaxID=3384766 RepID=UPI0039843E66
MRYKKLSICSYIFISSFVAIESYGQVEVINNPEKERLQDQLESPLSFELVQIFGSDFPDDSAVLSGVNSINGVKTDSSGNLYILDYGAKMLVKLSPNGEVLWKMDKRGRGPGDIETPLGIAVNDEMIVIANIYGTRLDVISTEGDYLESISTEEIHGYGMVLKGFLDNRYLVMVDGIRGKAGYRIVVLDALKSFKLVSDFHSEVDNDISIPEDETLVSSATITGDKIVVGGVWSYSYLYFDMFGNLEKKINREFSRYMKPGIYESGSGNHITFYGEAQGLYSVGGTYLLGYINWSTTIDDTDKLAKQHYNRNFQKLGLNTVLDLFSENGELLYTLENESIIPEIGMLMHSDQEGYLYTAVNRPYTMIKKYKIHFVE